MDTEIEREMWKSCFGELSAIEKEAMEKEAIGAFGLKSLVGRVVGGAGKAVAGKGRQLAQVSQVALQDPRAAGGLLKKTYQRAGGGLKGVGAVMKTPLGQAAGVTGAAGAAALAAPVLGGVALSGRGK